MNRERGEKDLESIVKRGLRIVKPMINRKIPSQEVEDVLGDFVLLLLRKIGTYEGKGSLEG